jgi:hypothetical protein
VLKYFCAFLVFMLPLGAFAQGVKVDASMITQVDPVSQLLREKGPQLAKRLSESIQAQINEVNFDANNASDGQVPFTALVGHYIDAAIYDEVTAELVAIFKQAKAKETRYTKSYLDTGTKNLVYLATTDKSKRVLTQYVLSDQIYADFLNYFVKPFFEAIDNNQPNWVITATDKAGNKSNLETFVTLKTYSGKEKAWTEYKAGSVGVSYNAFWFMWAHESYADVSIHLVIDSPYKSLNSVTSLVLAQRFTYGAFERQGTSQIAYFSAVRDDREVKGNKLKDGDDGVLYSGKIAASLLENIDNIGIERAVAEEY